jgi:hypothetical protein
MTNRLQAYVPAMFQPTDPVATDFSLQPDKTRRLTVFAAVSSAMLLVVLIALLMGMT